MEYLFTERAHLMCPNMNFGLAASIKTAFNTQKIKESVSLMSDSHPFLKALIGYEPQHNKYFYDITDKSQITLAIKNETITDIESTEIMKEYEKLTGFDWDILKEGMLKMTAWKMRENTCILFVFHHLLTDGRGALGLVREFADLYSNGTKPEFIPERLITENDLPENSKLPFISRMLVDRANKNWAKENNKALTYNEYHNYAEKYLKNDHIRHSLKKLNKHDVEKMVSESHKHSVTVNDLLVAEMMTEENTNKVIIASDLRKKLSVYLQGALGNYSTAFSVVVKKNKKDLFALADEVHKNVQKIMNKPASLYLVLRCYARLAPEILDASFMAATDGYESKSARFIGTMFFRFDMPKGYSITNLGKIESENIATAFFIPPASPAIRKTQGILTVNGEMIICTSER